MHARLKTKGLETTPWVCNEDFDDFLRLRKQSDRRYTILLFHERRALDNI